MEDSDILEEGEGENPHFLGKGDIRRYLCAKRWFLAKPRFRVHSIDPILETENFPDFPEWEYRINRTDFTKFSKKFFSGRESNQRTLSCGYD